MLWWLSLGPALAQTVPSAPLPAAVPAASEAPADTTRRPARVEAAVPAEPTAEVSRRSARRIVGVIALLTLTTLLLYNVRSR